MLKVPDKGTQRLLETADFFDTLDPKLYNQRRYRDGDQRCICGWVNQRAGFQADDEARACGLLGISREVGHKLFSASAGRRTSGTFYIFDDPTPKDAARTLRHLAVAGDVPPDWA